MTASSAERVAVSLGDRSYDIVIGSGVFDVDASFGNLAGGGAAVVVSSNVVMPLLGERLAVALRRRFRRVTTVTLPDGEAHKTWATLQSVFDALLTAHHDRSTTLVALGGGVVGDITGFAAACYMRGVDYIQVPTTLLAQVDSSVGGKTAINHPLGKNMIGAFHQPRLVVADVDVLSTLPQRELLAGLAEVIKYGAVIDAAFLDWIDANLDALLQRDPAALVHAVRRSCEIKAEVVAADELEAGRRALLNFGHTFAHAIEAGMGFGTWLHGEAVGCGMVLAARLSAQLGLIDASRADQLEAIVRRSGLPYRPPDVSATKLVELMRSDKKALAGRQRFVLLEGASGACVQSVPEADVERVIDRLRSP